MGRPVPEDDNQITEVTEAETAALDTNEEEAETEETQEAETTDEVVEEEAEAEEELSEASLAAISGDDRDGSVPIKRLNEVIADREAARRDAEVARSLAEQLLAERQQRAKPEPVADTARNFDADLKALRQKYKDGEIEMDDYLDAREALTIERAEAAAEAKFRPVAEQLQQETNRIRADKASSELEAAAKPIYAKFPFLDISSSEKNMEAIGRVLAVRDELIRAGVGAVRALKLAAAEVGPEYAHLVSDEVDEDKPDPEKIRLQRANAARRAAAEASAATPPPTGKAGAGTKQNPGKITLTRSVEDAERWEKMTPEQRKNVVIR